MAERMMVAMVAFKVTEQGRKEILNGKLTTADLIGAMALGCRCKIIAVSDLTYCNATPELINEI